jgi:hypothetical protein
MIFIVEIVDHLSIEKYSCSQKIDLFANSMQTVAARIKSINLKKKE